MSDVGYSRPPTHSQFKPGQSGNPKGRPPGRRSLATDLREALEAPTQVRANGQLLQMPKREALLNALIDSAVAGDMRAAGLLLQTLARVERTDGPEPAADAETEADFEDLVEREVQRRIREAGLATRGDANVG